MAQFVDESVLVDGTFFKISVEKSGIHKLDYNLLSKIPGIDIANLSVSDIALFGNQGGMLPEANNAARVDDLLEIPMAFNGNENDQIDGDEYFYFYAEGPDPIKYNTSSARFSQAINIYEKYNYYFLRIDKGHQKAIDAHASLSDHDLIVDTYDFFQKHESDQINLMGKNFGTQGSGKEWFGENLSNDQEQSFTDFFDLRDIVDQSDVHFVTSLAVRSDRTANASLVFGDTVSKVTTSSVQIPSQYGSYASVKKWDYAYRYDPAIGKSLSEISVRVDPRSSQYNAWLNYISLHAQKELVYNSEPLEFRSVKSIDNGRIQYKIISNGSSDLVIWDISDPFDAHQQDHSTANGTITFTDEGYALKTYIIFNPKEINSKPAILEQLENQNLHSIYDADNIIIYHELFEEQAQQLADHRTTFSGLNTIALDVDQVFNEFAGGSKDPVAIRDFARMLYTRSANFQFLCLFGDASYDYRGIDPELPKSSLVPCWETAGSLNPVNSFPSDDFFALLDDHEGDNLIGALDIAVGRIPVESEQEAQTVVDKLINYDTKSDFLGDWRNYAIYVADDEESQHVTQSETLVRQIRDTMPTINARKIYFDEFTQVSTVGDDRYPDAKRTLNDYMYQGALFLNYFGHGGPNGWAQERVLELQDILKWSNSNRLPFFITATCTFTGFDDAAVKSGGELSLLNPNGGVIGLVSTTRAVQIGANGRLATAFTDHLFTRENGSFIPMGEVLRRGKNSNRSDTLDNNARKFLLIGDPAFRLAIPHYKAKVTSFQNKIADGQTRDTIGALEQVQFEGIITDLDGSLKSDFNGNASITVFDKSSKITTKGNDGRSPRNFEARRTVIYKGKVPVAAGKFSVEFTVPKDINYAIGRGRISIYALNDKKQDATGHFEDFMIGGTSNNLVIDDNPPDIQLFMNNTSFIDGGITGPDPVLLIEAVDDYGFNISNSSIGHEMVAVLDGDLRNQIILNDFFEADASNSKAGTIRYPLSNLEEGEHHLFVRMWDVANNPGEAEITFRVEQGSVEILKNVLAIPNPATNEVRFKFNHDLNGVTINTRIDIYDYLGRQVSKVEESITTGSRTLDNITWNRIGYHGDELQSGVYIYRITASTEDVNGQQLTATSEGRKLVLL
jgi:hypothetical protein